MRLWSIHPKYLDAKGLVALWREGLLAQKVLKGETRGYRNHPQLDRFKKTRDPIVAIGKYLLHIHKESLQRDYKFDLKKIGDTRSRMKIEVSSGQIEFERQHLLKKLKSRERSLYFKIQKLADLDVHPIFRVVPGNIADWEITI
jgi:pyrimidine dimer DNA glycosylase